MAEEGRPKKDFINLIKGYNMLLYFTGSMIMYEPREDCAIDFLSDGLLKRLPVSSSNPLFIKAAGLLREPFPGRELFKDMLVKDYKLLFSPEGSMLAIPRKSAYPEQKMIHGPSDEPGDFYSSYGWKTNTGEGFPDDHLGIELLFLTKLTDKFIQFEDEPCMVEMKKEIRRFIGHHLLGWIPEWNRRIQARALTNQYKGIGNMIEACVDDLYAIFDQRNKLL